MKLKQVCFSIILISGLLVSASLAYNVSIVGGLRDGLAFGIEDRETLFNDLNWVGNYGVAASTGEDYSLYGDNPFILFAGIKKKTGQLGFSPVFLGAGLFAYCGTTTDPGISLSARFENIFNKKQLFLEVGVDMLRKFARLQLQVGTHL